MKAEHKRVTIKENDVCSFWEPDDEPAIAVIKECWFCKWSDFRVNVDKYKSVGYCLKEIYK